MLRKIQAQQKLKIINKQQNINPTTQKHQYKNQTKYASQCYAIEKNKQQIKHTSQCSAIQKCKITNKAHKPKHCNTK